MYTIQEKRQACVNFVKNYMEHAKVTCVSDLHLQETVSMLDEPTMDVMMTEDADTLDAVCDLSKDVIERAYKAQVCEEAWERVKRGEMELFVDTKGRIKVEKVA
jgi:hypothetical protein